MNVKSEKGYTGVDISISIVVLFIFVSLIAMLAYNVNSSAKEIELKSQATEIAVTQIEELKTKKINEIKNFEQAEPKEIKPGFYETVTVNDYADIVKDSKERDEDIVKKVTVTIKYKFKKETQEIALSTIVTEED